MMPPKDESEPLKIEWTIMKQNGRKWNRIKSNKIEYDQTKWNMIKKNGRE